MVFVVLAFSACQPVVDPDHQLIADSFVRTEDLPAGWFNDGARIEDVAGAVSQITWYRPSRDPDLESVLVSQQLALYPDEASAMSGFEQWTQEVFPNEQWQSPAQLQFESDADQFSLACLPIFFATGPTHLCNAVSRYGPMMSIIRADVWDKNWFTFDDLQKLLEAADRRVSMAAEP